MKMKQKIYYIYIFYRLSDILYNINKDEVIQQKCININYQIEKHLTVMIKYCERVLNNTKKQELYNAEDSDSVKIIHHFHSEVLDSEHINDFNYV